MGKKDKNLNNSLHNVNATNFEHNLEENFNKALELSNNEHSYESLISLLSSNKIADRQFAALELTKILSKNDAIKLVNNLFGQDGKIREAVAYKINELMHDENSRIYFLAEEIFEKLVFGIMDINGNVCRNIIEITQIAEFKNYLAEKILPLIEETLKKIDTLSEHEKQYVISKRNFQLYWLLEALSKITDKISYEKIVKYLEKTAEFEDYTVREKTAKILSKYNDVQTKHLKEKLLDDENYYVKKQLM